MLTGGSFVINPIPAIEKLEKTIIELNSATEKQTGTTVRLTWAITAMTAVMVIGVAVQIYLALPKI
jgi:hypothetical protein